MKYIKNAFFFNSSFSEKSGRVEYGIYILVCFSMNYLALYLYGKVNLNTPEILNIFYSCLIILLTFIPFQAVTARRLRDLNASPNFIFFNFIPFLNIAFVAFLLFAERKN